MARILVIEDDPIYAAMMTESLAKAGHATATAGNGRDGLALLARQHDTNQPFDLVVTDIIMPDREGIETIRDIRAHDATLPIIAVSGGSTSVDLKSYLSFAAVLGASLTMAKPFRPAELVAAVAGLLAGREQGGGPP